MQKPPEIAMHQHMENNALTPGKQGANTWKTRRKHMENNAQTH